MKDSDSLDGRRRILNALLDCSRPLDDLARELGEFDWDCERALVVLSRSHLANIFNLFLEGRVGPVKLEQWANLIELRDDIGYEPNFADELSDVVYRLANPILEGEIDSDAICGMALELNLEDIEC